MREEAGNIWKYNDPENFALREALAAHLGVSAANIAIGSGIDELLGQIVRLVIEPGRPSSPLSALIQPSTSMSPVSAAGW